MAALLAQRDGVRQLIVAEATAQGVPAALALAVAWQESGWQQGVVSYAGAIGIMQLIPASGEWVAQSMLGERVNLYDAGSNVRAGVRLLRHYLDRYAGDRSLALAAYYQGQTAVDREGIYSVSRPYIASILQLEQIFSR
jgi:soluble lytic murein transglycosylase-like protein